VRVYAGGGIMPDSVPEVELAETRAKMEPVLQALGVVPA
jgi:menaquinone-specific isochorismate synthase